MNRMMGTIGFERDIEPLISDGERACMMATRSGIDLHDWAVVSRKAEDILKHLKGEAGFAPMPPGDPWPADKIALFENWVAEGTPLGTGEDYASFFRAVDARTEYVDVYGEDAGVEDLKPYYSKFWGKDLLLKNQWIKWFQASSATPILKRQKEQLWVAVVRLLDSDPALVEAVMKVDQTICQLASLHFSSASGFDPRRCLDAYSRFGDDTLPYDQGRYDRVAALGDPSDYRLVNDLAPHHRMDTRELYFYWFGHLQLARHLAGAADPNRGIRDALVAGVLVGQVSDTAFREGSSRRTRREYLDSRDTVWQTGLAVVEDFAAAAEEMQQLYYLLTAAVIA